MTTDATTTGEGDVVLDGERLVVRTVTIGDAGDLALLTRRDSALRDAAGMRLSDDESPDTFLGGIRDWARERNAICMSVVLGGDTAIGMITLGHIDRATRAGRIGYWIGSEYWGRGYMTEAFALVLSFARRLSLRTVFAHIEPDNIPSLRLWRRYGAAESEGQGNRLRVALDLDQTPAHQGAGHTP